MKMKRRTFLAGTLSLVLAPSWRQQVVATPHYNIDKKKLTELVGLTVEEFNKTRWSEIREQRT